MTDICKYLVITVYKKLYNKWFTTGEKKYWSMDLAKNEKKKFKVEARMIDNKVLGYEDVLLDSHVHLSKYIIRVVYGTMIVSFVSMLIHT